MAASYSLFTFNTHAGVLLQSQFGDCLVADSSRLKDSRHDPDSSVALLLCYAWSLGESPERGSPDENLVRVRCLYRLKFQQEPRSERLGMVV